MDFQTTRPFLNTSGCTVPPWTGARRGHKWLAKRDTGGRSHLFSFPLGQANVSSMAVPAANQCWAAPANMGWATSPATLLSELIPDPNNPAPTTEGGHIEFVEEDV